MVFYVEQQAECGQIIEHILPLWKSMFLLRFRYDETEKLECKSVLVRFIQRGETPRKNGYTYLYAIYTY